MLKASITWVQLQQCPIQQQSRWVQPASLLHKHWSCSKALVGRELAAPSTSVVHNCVVHQQCESVLCRTLAVTLSSSIGAAQCQQCSASKQ